MSIETATVHTTPVGGNVFADLGFEPQEAAALKAESQRRIAEKLVIRGTLVAELAEWVKSKHLTHAEAAEFFGITRSRVLDVVHQRAGKFTIDILVVMLVRAGKRVQISVR